MPAAPAHTDRLPRNAAALLVSASDVARHGDVAVAALFGASYSPLAITPSQACLAPPVVRSALARFATWDATADVELAGSRIVDLGDAAVHDLPWEQAFTAMRDLAAEAFGLGLFTVGLGGDHSVSWPLITAFARQHQRVGIVQLDAHHDVRPYDGGISNGCPIRGLIDSGTVRGSDVVQIGIQPFSNGAALAGYCDAAGIHRYSAQELRRRGTTPTARAALRRLARCDAIYLTVDIDVLDRAYAPGTSAALPGGLTPHEVYALIREVVADPRVAAMDVVEFDPARDVADVTAYSVAQSLLTGVTTSVARGRRTA